MNKTLAIVSGVGIGAGLMYILDPNSGKRRRAMVGDKVIHLAHVVEDGVESAARDVNNRAHGLVARTRTAFTQDDAEDSVIESRVRARLGRYVSHPHAIDVKCEKGRVTVAGPILAAEVEALLNATSKVRGVCDVINWLEIHGTAGSFPALQGGRRRSGQAEEGMGTGWLPAARLVAGTLGGGLAAYAALRRANVTRRTHFAKSEARQDSESAAGVGCGCCGDSSISD